MSARGVTAEGGRFVPQQTRSERTRDAILEAARSAVVTFGRDAFTTADVARLAGVSIGTVYRYYRDRVALLDVIAPNREQLTREMLMRQTIQVRDYSPELVAERVREALQ